MADQALGALLSAELAQETCVRYILGACAIHVVSSLSDLPCALEALRNSLLGAGGEVAIDLEWRPEWRGARQPTRVALIQLATPSVCLLVRTCLLPLTPPLQAFLSNPAVTLVGFGWEGGDEAKMQLSFGFGRARFGAFQDLQALAMSMGYFDQGMAALATSVLGVPVEKDRKVAVSNWEAEQLSAAQIKYAARDVLLTYHTHRQLRQWQAAGAQAPACQQCPRRLGTAIRPRWTCLTCTMCFVHKGAMEGHALTHKHDTGLRQCGGCGRVLVLEAPPPAAPGPLSEAERAQQEAQREEMARAGVLFEAPPEGEGQGQEAGGAWGGGEWGDGAWGGGEWGEGGWSQPGGWGQQAAAPPPQQLPPQQQQAQQEKRQQQWVGRSSWGPRKQRQQQQQPGTAVVGARS